MDEVARVRERFARFAAEEAPGRSDVYEEWAGGVAGDGEIAAILARIPASHRQPPLVFAVTRLRGAAASDYASWAAFVRADAEGIVAECAARSLQTNEPLRCAALLPALSLVDGPVALLELGASGGLCLFPDRYSYRYAGAAGEVALDPADGASPVVLAAELRGSVVPAVRMPEIVWRAGIDLQPRDPRDPDDRAWLAGLVWPGETGRAERIAAAVDVAASGAPRLVAGDVADLALLREVAASAPVGATLVITTPGLLPYLPRARREALVAGIRDLDARWVTLDQPALHDAWTTPIDPGTWGDGFALALDGDVLAAADPLGSWLHWRA
ncbi:DUF2332 domain-containing protein [Microbacterium betulae]|uniref:DUF2332 domain-containing protein n=1 Tax=Microbacterium betulae TaxID=2981139 RepID=A0AA97FLZ1_9MICO|nr:DUF2332 domain-containing protein [Microbacterium sp. AB]WOF23872.1 DUF2332 domain-containing protein [Microbacterium sp. AB]